MGWYPVRSCRHGRLTLVRWHNALHEQPGKAVNYEIAEQPVQLVTIVAVGVKDRNRVLIGGKKIKL